MSVPPLYLRLFFSVSETTISSSRPRLPDTSLAIALQLLNAVPGARMLGMLARS